MFIILVAVAVCLGGNQMDIPVFYSNLTPSTLLNEFRNFSKKTLFMNIDFENYALGYNDNLFIDLTMDSSKIPIFDEIAEISNAKYVTITDQMENQSSSKRIYSLSNSDQELNALIKLIKWFELKEFILLSSSIFKCLKLSEMIKNSMEANLFKHITYPENLNIEYALNLIQKEIKITGLSSLIIVDQGPSLEIIQKALISKRINDTGSLFIFTSLSMGSIIIEGSLILSQKNIELSTSYSNYLYLSIISSIESLQYSAKSSDSSIFSILNLTPNSKVIVGSISSNVSISTPILYPGLVYSLNSLNKKEITFLIANGTNEVANAFQYSLFSYFYNGAIYAVNQVNSQNIIPRHKINLRPTDTGIFGFYEDWYMYKLSQVLYNPQPVVYLTSYWHTSAYGNAVVLKKMNNSLPQISPFAQKSIVESKEEFPDFVKLSISEDDFLLNGVNFIVSQNWDSIVLLGTDDETFYSYVVAAERLCKARGVKIVNPQKFRIFPSNYTRDDFEKYKSYFQAAKDTRCRIYLIFAWERGSIWDGLYEIGLRKGDFYTISDQATLTYLNEAIDIQILNNRRELVGNSFILGYKEWNGIKGQQLYQELNSLYPEISYFCMCYDTVSVAVSAINYAINLGKDYENHQDLMKIIRYNKVQGCMGNVYFSKDSTNIANAKFLISQVIKDKSSKFYASPLAYLDKLSVTFIEYVNKTVWPDSSNPSNFIPIYDCPFEERDIKDSDKGFYIMTGIIIVIYVVTLVAAWLSHKEFKTKYVEFNDAREMSLSDKAFFIYYLLQFFQFMIMGPDQDAYRQVVRNLDSLISLEFEKFYDLNKDKFWMAYYSVLIFAGVWNLICVMFVFKCEVRYSNTKFSEFFKTLQQLILPLISSVMFLPLLSMLLNLFICSKSTGSGFEDLFMDKDCFYTCYVGDHKKIAVVAFIIIFFFALLSVYLKPFWEINQTCLSIRTKSVYLSSLSILQVTLVGLNKTLKIKNQLVHGSLCSALVFTFILFTAWLKPYNYAQANISQMISLSLSFWGIFTATIFHEIGDLMIWTLTQFMGFTFIILVGILFYTRTPNLLKNKKGMDISSLFIFQFCKDYEKYARDRESIQFLRRGSKYILDDPTKLAIDSEGKLFIDVKKENK